jgi:hypothetical protein
MTSDEAVKLLEAVEAGKVIPIRIPPWLCPDCKQKTITKFEWVDSQKCFKATCSKCGTHIYS